MYCGAEVVSVTPSGELVVEARYRQLPQGEVEVVLVKKAKAEAKRRAA